jgi:hypothetical protein
MRTMACGKKARFRDEEVNRNETGPAGRGRGREGMTGLLLFQSSYAVPISAGRTDGSKRPTNASTNAGSNCVPAPARK